MKRNIGIGKVLLSVAIAVAMTISAVPAIASEPETPPTTLHAVELNADDTVGGLLPNGYIVLDEDFTADPGWTITNASGDGNWSHNATYGTMNWTDGTNFGDTEDDTLSVDVDLSGLPLCVNAVNLEFFDYGDGGDYELYVDADLIDTITTSTTWTERNYDITSYAGSSVTISWVVGAGTVRNMSIDDVLISYNVDSDIYINGIEGLSDGGVYNTFPKTINVNISNLGATNLTDVDFHLQIYQEIEIETEEYVCWYMESCILRTWETLSADGDMAGWYWTETRSNSPTHSWASKPDYVDTYEGASEDYLYLQEPYTIPDEVDGNTVTTAILTFYHWAEGEFDGSFPVDYGKVFIENATYTYPTLYDTGGYYYDTDGEWVKVEIDISDFIGQDINIWFGWFADDYVNYEGWYIDDVCIELAYTSLQPLVFQGYKYTDLAANETKTIQFPIDFEPENDTYFIQVYSDYEDCIPDNHELGNGYADEINWTVTFGDICDAAALDVEVDDEFILNHSPLYETWINIPINVTVENTGTLTEDVPVKISAKHIIHETYFKDDVEGGVPEETYTTGDFGAAGEVLWHIDDFDFYSPYNAWSFFDSTYHYGAGYDNYWIIETDAIDWGAVEDDHNFDIEFNMKYNLNPLDNVYVAVAAGNYIITLSSTGSTADLGWPSSAGWARYGIMDWLDEAGYTNAYPGDQETLGQFGRYICDAFGFTYPDDFRGYGLIVFGEDYGIDTHGKTDDAYAGVIVDDIEAYTVYAGEEVWSTTYTVEGMEPGDVETFEVIWNTTEYCDYLIEAEIILDCDEDPSNNVANDQTRIVDILYEDFEEWTQEDNTYGEPGDWEIVALCSLCPDNHFWWINGSDQDDLLIIDEVFNFSDVIMAYLNFSTVYRIEEDWDYVYVEVSNDSGVHWYTLTEYTGNNTDWPDWTSMAIPLVPGVTTITSPYTGLADFTMPVTYFTDQMHFRFRFVSDSLISWKGIYIDDVNITAYNGSAWNTLFFDDMESGDGNWLNLGMYYGCHWHEEDTFGAGPTAMWFWNGNNVTYLGTGIVESWGRGLTPFFSEWSGTGGFGFFWFGDGDAGFYDLGTPGSTGEFQITVDGSGWGGSVSFDLTYWQLNFAFGASGITANVDVWDGTTSLSTPLPNTAPGVNNTITIDISAFAGSPAVNIAINVTNTIGFDWMGLTSAYINTTAPIVPDESYYANVDEKLIMEFDLTKAYYAELVWQQNYSFADSEDQGLVEVWDGSAWKTLFIVSGAGPSWSDMMLDISDYVGGDEFTRIRFRFVSDDTGTDYGWLIDNVGIIGKVDYKEPTIACAIDPATPNGNNGWYTSGVTFTATATDNVDVDTIYYRIDGGAWKVYTGPITISVDGEHTVEAYAVDEVGNPSEICIKTFKIDATAPTVTITAPQSGYIYFMGRELFANPLGGTIIIGGIEFSASASDAMSGVDYVTFEVDGMTYEKAVSPYSIWWHKFDLLPTSYTLTVSAYDEAGNKASDATLSFTHWL